VLVGPGDPGLTGETGRGCQIACVSGTVGPILHERGFHDVGFVATVYATVIGAMAVLVVLGFLA
jgi:hypothetical protein